jgi:hypothetical protein
MREAEEQEIKEKMGNSLIQTPNPKKLKLKKKQQKKLNKVKFLPLLVSLRPPFLELFSQMLTQIFGKSNVPSSVTQPAQDDRASNEIRERALRSVQSIQRDQKVTETRKFAGQSIQ